MTIIYFILILGVIVFIHELGHFIFAKRAGIYVYEFSIGMGPRIFKFTRNKKIKDKKGKVKIVKDETTYSIRLFPIGGFVQMAGEEIELDKNIREDQRMQSKTWMQRFLTMVAGVTFNFILAILLLFIIGLSKGVSLDTRYLTDIDKNIYPKLEVGDKIVKINNNNVNNYDKLVLELQVQNEKSFDMTVKHENGKKDVVKINPILVGKSGLVKNIDYGFTVDKLTIKESSIKELKKDFKIVKINDIEINTYNELLYQLNKIGINEFKLTLDNGNNITIAPKELKDDNTTAYSYGFYIDGKEESGLIPAIKYAIFKFFSTIEQMFFILLYLFTGKLSLGMLSGPVGLYGVVGQAANNGIISLLSLTALFSINVGFINLLPFPAFDGGRAFFLIIEKIKGSPVNPKIENIIHTIGFYLLMALMVYITFNDILKIF